MADKISKIGEKLFDTDIVQDIHELVVEMKQTVLKLEDIACSAAKNCKGNK